MAAVNQSGLSILPTICEERQNEEVNDGTVQEKWETTMDRGRLVRFRAAARTQHTIQLDNLMEAVRKCLHRDIVSALRAKVVRQFEKVDQRHDRLSSLLFTDTKEMLLEEQGWYRHVSDNHRAVMTHPLQNNRIALLHLVRPSPAMQEF